MSKYFKIIIGLGILFPSITLAAVNSSAGSGVGQILLSCSTSQVGCGWVELMALANAIVSFFALYLLPIGLVIVLSYAGYLYLTAGGNESQVKKAHDMLTTAVVGTVVTLAGWLIIYSIVNWLGVDPNFRSII